MPRPRRSHGRPGTSVIPKAWEASHRPVVSKTLGGRCTIHAPSAPAALQVKPDLTYEPAGEPAAALYDGPFRAQALNAKEAAGLVGDQEQITTGYLLVVDADADVPVRSVVTIADATDQTLVGVRLVVRKIARGSHRFERDLWCVEDLTDTPDVITSND